MEEKPKYQGRGGYRGGGRPPGINQVKKPFKLNKDLLEDYEGVDNQNGLINELLRNHFSGFLFQIGGLVVSKKGDLFAIQDTSSGEYWEVASLDFEMSLRKLF